MNIQFPLFIRLRSTFILFTVFVILGATAYIVTHLYLSTTSYETIVFLIHMMLLSGLFVCSAVAQVDSRPQIVSGRVEVAGNLKKGPRFEVVNSVKSNESRTFDREKFRIDILKLKKGPGISGGGFSFENTSLKYLNEAQKRLASRLRAVSQKESIVRLFQKWNANGFSIDSLLDIVQNIELKPEAIISRENSNGQKDLLKFDFDSSTHRISVLLPFFLKYDTDKLTSDDIREIETAILHEASHLYGVGIHKDQDSESLALEVMKVLNNQFLGCGNTINDLQGRLQDCENTYGKVAYKDYQLVSAYAWKWNSLTDGKNYTSLFLTTSWYNKSNHTYVYITHQNGVVGRDAEGRAEPTIFYGPQACSASLKKSVETMGLSTLTVSEFLFSSNKRAQQNTDSVQASPAVKALALSPWNRFLGLGGFADDFKERFELLTQSSDGSVDGNLKALDISICTAQVSEGRK